jgi:hypothetical protein
MGYLAKRFLLLQVILTFAIIVSTSNSTSAKDCARESGNSGATSEAPASEPAFSPNTDLVFSVNKTVNPPQIDGRLDEDLWKRATRVSNFCEITPGDNVRPKVITEALFTYDNDNLYIGFICHESDPDAIRATICDRDHMFSDDFAGIMIDTFKDQQNGYEFFVNPYGIQGDLRRTPNSEDSSFDTVWESAGEINSHGWTAEFAIPFRSIRFPDRYEQQWGIHILRIRPRDSREQISWAPISRDESCLFCQAGTIEGIKGVNRGKNFEFLPYVLASQSGSLKDEENPSLGFHNDNLDADGGFGIKYGITPNLTLDFAYNPDFSQIESDAAQLDVNTTFALSFPEKRPFFLEGSDIFSTTASVVYTRSINDPLAAAKITGKVGKYTVGYIFGWDEASPFVVPFEDWSEAALGGRSVSNVLRLKRDILTDSNVGLIVTDRRLSDGSNFVFGLDENVRFMENYRMTTQVLYSHTKEPNDPALSSDFTDTTFGGKNYTSTFDGEAFPGYGILTSLRREARHWNFSLNYNDISPTLRAENGFIANNNYRMGTIWTGAYFQPNNSILDAAEPAFNWGRKLNYNGAFKDTWYAPQISIVFKKQTSIWTQYIWSKERFKNVLVKGISRSEGNISTNASEKISGGFYWRVGRSVAREEDPPVLGRERTYEIWGTLKPTPRLMFDADYTFSKMLGPDASSELFRGYITRSRLTYQFTRCLFLRLVTQYNNFNREIEIDPLLSYKINPFTVFFVGSTHRLEDYGSTVNYGQSERQFFIKFQYLFRV